MTNFGTQTLNGSERLLIIRSADGKPVQFIKIIQKPAKSISINTADVSYEPISPQKKTRIVRYITGFGTQGILHFLK